MVSENIAGYVLTLRNFKIVTGHDDSLPFNATLYINGQRVCKCFNDGWGGVANCSDFTAKGRALFDAVSAALSTMTFQIDTLSITKSIGDIIDELAAQMEDERATARAVKSHQTKALVFANDACVYWIPFKNKANTSMYISQVVMTAKGRELIKRIVDGETAKGARFLNTNIDIKSF